VGVEESTTTLVLVLLVLFDFVLGHADRLGSLSVGAGLAITRVVGLIDAGLEVTVGEVRARVITAARSLTASHTFGVCAGLAIVGVVAVIGARLEVTVAEMWASVVNRRAGSATLVETLGGRWLVVLVLGSAESSGTCNTKSRITA